MALTTLFPPTAEARAITRLLAAWGTLLVLKRLVQAPQRQNMGRTHSDDLSSGG